MSGETTNVNIVCLNIGMARPTLIETDGDDLLEEADKISKFRYAGTEDMSDDALNEWVQKKLSLMFDGDLDEPEKFVAISAKGAHGPRNSNYSEDGLLLSDLSIYLEVKTEEEPKEDELDDLFHLIVLTIEDGASSSQYTEFEEYSAEIEDEFPSEIKLISVDWEYS